MGFARPAAVVFAALLAAALSVAPAAAAPGGTESGTAGAPEAADWTPPGILGLDVSGHQGEVDWAAAWERGARFAYVKATEGPADLDQAIRNTHFTQQYDGARRQGMLRGAYHFALPASSSGKDQADYFVDHGGDWVPDGMTLPPLLDIEWNPYSAKKHPDGLGDMCYGLDPAEMVDWIGDFSDTVEERTGRRPMIYTARTWWDKCTGSSTAFADHALHVALYPGSDPRNPRELPEGWSAFQMWQFSSEGPFVGDSNVWNGTLQSLKDFAGNAEGASPVPTTSYLGQWREGAGRTGQTVLSPVRVGGGTRYESAVAVSRSHFPSTAGTVVVASGEHFADALTASPLARRHSAPLLLISRDTVPAAVSAELERLRPSRIHLVGGTAAVSNGVAAALGRFAPVTRIGGPSMYGTNARVAATWSTAPTVFLASGRTYQDAMALAAAAARHGQPLLLTPADRLPAETMEQLERLAPETLVIAGGSGAVSIAVDLRIKLALPDTRIVRLYGESVHETGAAIAAHHWPDGSQRQVFASDSSYASALAGPLAAAYNDAPLLLTRRDCLPEPSARALAGTRGWTSILLGGTDAIGPAALYTGNGASNIC